MMQGLYVLCWFSHLFLWHGDLIDFSLQELSYFGHKINNRFCNSNQMEWGILKIHEYLTPKATASSIFTHSCTHLWACYASCHRDEFRARTQLHNRGWLVKQIDKQLPTVRFEILLVPLFPPHRVQTELNQRSATQETLSPTKSFSTISACTSYWCSFGFKPSVVTIMEWTALLVPVTDWNAYRA